MYVCICKAITEKQIEEAAQTASSLSEVCKKLGVGSECGLCLTDVNALQKFKPNQQNTDSNNNSN